MGTTIPWQGLIGQHALWFDDITNNLPLAAECPLCDIQSDTCADMPSDRVILHTFPQFTVESLGKTIGQPPTWKEVTALLSYMFGCAHPHFLWNSVGYKAATGSTADGPWPASHEYCPSSHLLRWDSVGELENPRRAQ
jgi:hypothetical protein